MTPATTGSHARATRRLGPLAILLIVLSGLALLIAACGPTATATPTPVPDAASVVARAAAAPMDVVKVQVGVEATADGETISIEPSQIEAIVDTQNGKGSFHLSLPKAILGEDAAMLPVTGDTIDVDVLFDGQALYLKSPLAATLLPMLLLQSGQPIPGDLSGWIKLGTAEELGGLAQGLGGMVVPSADPSVSPLASATPEEIEQQLADAGITITYVGIEQRNGVDSDHVKVDVDLEKLAASEFAAGVPSGQLEQLEGMAGSGTLSADAWFNRSTGQLNEIAINVGGDAGETATITILVSDPGDVSLDAPADAVELPIMPLIQTLMESFGGAFPTP
jgi:hypothetical protein